MRGVSIKYHLDELSGLRDSKGSKSKLNFMNEILKEKLKSKKKLPSQLVYGEVELLWVLEQAKEDIEEESFYHYLFFLLVQMNFHPVYGVYFSIKMVKLHEAEK